MEQGGVDFGYGFKSTLAQVREKILSQNEIFI